MTKRNDVPGILTQTHGKGGVPELRAVDATKQRLVAKSEDEPTYSNEVGPPPGPEVFDRLLDALKAARDRTEEEFKNIPSYDRYLDQVREVWPRHLREKEDAMSETQRILEAAATPPAAYARIAAAMRACRKFTLARDEKSGRVENAWNYDGTDHGVVYEGEDGWKLDARSSMLSPVGALLIADNPCGDVIGFDATPDPDYTAAHILGTRHTYVIGLCEGFARRPTSYQSMVGKADFELFIDGLTDGFALRAEFAPGGIR